MDSCNGSAQPDRSDGPDVTSNERCSKKARVDSPTRPSSHYPRPASPSTSTLHFPRAASTNKRKRPTSPTRHELDHQLNNSLQQKDNVRLDDTDDMHLFKRKKIQPPAPNDPSPQPSSSTSDDVNATLSDPKKGKSRPSPKLNVDPLTLSRSTSTAGKTKMSKRKRAYSPRSAGNKPRASSSKHDEEPTELLEPTTFDPSMGSKKTQAQPPSSLYDSTSPLDPACPSPTLSYTSLGQDEDQDQDAPPMQELETADPRSVVERLDEAVYENQRIAYDTANLNNLLRTAVDELEHIKQKALDDQKRQQAENDKMKKWWVKMGMDAMLDRARLQEQCRRQVGAERLKLAKANAYHQAEVTALKEQYDRQIKDLKTAFENEISTSKKTIEDLEAEKDEGRKRLLEAVEEGERLMDKWTTSEAEAQNNRFLWGQTEQEIAAMAEVWAEEREEARSIGLPPAYGSLDDEDNAPPWGRHEDLGSVQIALIKDVARKEFKLAFETAMERFNAHRTSTDQPLRKRAPTFLFFELSKGLSNVCFRLGGIVNVEPSNSDRVAKLLFEFTWQIISAFAIRATELTLDRTAHVQCDMFWRSVDGTLAHAVELTFKDKGLTGSCAQCKNSACPGYCVRLSELQTLVEQLKVVQGHLQRLDNRIYFFAKTRAWVEEMLEADLKCAADVALPPTRPHSPAAGEEGVAL